MRQVGGSKVGGVLVRGWVGGGMGGGGEGGWLLGLDDGVLGGCAGEGWGG